ncbi:MAG: hypothetical protein ACI8QS_000765 [Planctomycetota bacterium]|jgi:hypothetical protein
MFVRDLIASSTSPSRLNLGLVGSLVAGFILSLATSSCGSLPRSESVFREQTVMKGPDLITDLAPTDVLIAPLRNQTEREDVPVDLLRAALHDNLVERLYSPLDLKYTDSYWVESTFTGEDPPEAILVASITHWSTSGLSGQGTLEIGVDLRIFRGGSTAGEAIWAGQVNRILNVVEGGHPPFGPEEELVERGALLWAQEALSVLPERDPLAR